MAITENGSLGYKERNSEIGHGKMRVQPGRAMVHPCLPIWVFSFHFKKTPQICYRRKYTGRKGRKERRNRGREEGRKGEREERTKRGGKKGMRRRTLWCLPDTHWRLWVVKLWLAVQSSRLFSSSWAELLRISSHVRPRMGHRIPL